MFVLMGILGEETEFYRVCLRSYFIVKDVIDESCESPDTQSTLLAYEHLKVSNAEIASLRRLEGEAHCCVSSIRKHRTTCEVRKPFGCTRLRDGQTHQNRPYNEVMGRRLELNTPAMTFTTICEHDPINGLKYLTPSVYLFLYITDSIVVKSVANCVLASKLNNEEDHEVMIARKDKTNAFNI
ncbi:hypothetical protein BDF20DRAFT_838304 [Mycotypha africana]|uniref:uncharacterized protein n=1 Tax=Mycotypha africana TaxID=64632 RepID=UPI0023011225|nr:uncharacterized protein BDF20DRAFT_838304 [Mycotypha africana]KAI8972038.1 hypothetical protein BDF20DRAFT_838304 [Mycotypha africana]